MSGWGNVPDDWGCYFTRCSRCGTRYHESEGGCGCMDDLECQCGACSWDNYSAEEPTCSKCGTRPYVEGRTQITEHTARKEHGQDIHPGDRYRKIVTFGYFPGGARSMSVRKVRLSKGAAWDNEEAAA